jgi:hypothetical protein
LDARAPGKLRLMINSSPGKKRRSEKPSGLSPHDFAHIINETINNSKTIAYFLYFVNSVCGLSIISIYILSK